MNSEKSPIIQIIKEYFKAREVVTQCIQEGYKLTKELSVKKPDGTIDFRTTKVMKENLRLAKDHRTLYTLIGKSLDTLCNLFDPNSREINNFYSEYI